MESVLIDLFFICAFLLVCYFVTKNENKQFERVEAREQLKVAYLGKIAEGIEKIRS